MNMNMGLFIYFLLLSTVQHKKTNKRKNKEVASSIFSYKLCIYIYSYSSQNMSEYMLIDPLF